MNRAHKRLILKRDHICGNACFGDRIYKKKGISQVPLLRPNINGLLVVGGTRPSGTSFNNPSARGYRISIDPTNDTFTYNELWRREIDNFVHKDDGQKILIPSFEGFSSRCFIRGRSSGSAASGENTVRNGLIEIDPETGDYLTPPFDLPGGGSFTELFEIGYGERLYLEQTDRGGIWVYDMDFNQIDSYEGALNNEPNGTDFGVGPSMNVVMLGLGEDIIQYYSRNKSTDFTITFPEIGDEFTEITEVRCDNSNIVAVDRNNDDIFLYSISNRSVVWSRKDISDLGSTVSIDYNGDIVIARNPGSFGGVLKLDRDTGDTIWNSNVTESLTSSASITQVGNVTSDYIFAWAGVIGVLFLLKDDGTVLDNALGSIRGNIGIHPFTGERVTNFINE